MKTLFLVITAAAFIQSSFLPLDLVLIILMAKSFKKSEHKNLVLEDLVLAFYGGLVLSILTSQNLGMRSAIFLILVQIIHLFKKLPVSQSYLTVFPQALLLLGLNFSLEKILFQTSVNLYILMLEAVLVLLFFGLFNLLQDRFVVKKEIRLRMKQ